MIANVLIVLHVHLGAYCDRSFKTTIQLTNHVNTHLGVKPFQVSSLALVNNDQPTLMCSSANSVRFHLQQVEN